MTRPHIKVFMEAASLLVSCELNARHLDKGGFGPAPVDAALAKTFGRMYRDWLDQIRELGPDDAADRIVNDVWFPALVDCAPEIGQPLLDYWLATVIAVSG
jgi:hypothetical protein